MVWNAGLSTAGGVGTRSRGTSSDTMAVMSTPPPGAPGPVGPDPAAARGPVPPGSFRGPVPPYGDHQLVDFLERKRARNNAVVLTVLFAPVVWGVAALFISVVMSVIDGSALISLPYFILAIPAGVVGWILAIALTVMVGNGPRRRHPVLIALLGLLPMPGVLLLAALLARFFFGIG